MSEESELHQLLGAVKSEMRESQRQRSALFSKIDEIRREVHETYGCLQQVNFEKRVLEEKVANMEPIVEDYAKMKQRGMGIIAFVGFLGSGVGGGAVLLWQKLFGP